MIVIRDWIPAIPLEEKSLAYVGENKAVSKEFLLTGEGWEAYRDWSFYLDMAFDLSSVTKREVFLQETTLQTENENVTRLDSTEAENSTQSHRQQTESRESDLTKTDKGTASETAHDTTVTENGAETGELSVTDGVSESRSEDITSNTTGTASTTVTKENRTVTQVVVDCEYPTDIAPLTKDVTEEGLLLTWTVLRQHTVLPGRLRAVVRAVGNGGEIKKSDIMVLTVEPSVCATPAAQVPVSEFEQMEQQMRQVCNEILEECNDVVAEAEQIREQVGGMAREAQQAADSAWEQAAAAASAVVTAANEAQTAARSAETARQAAAEAQSYAAATLANSANAIHGVAEGELIRIADISPLEHPYRVTVEESNLIPFPYTDTTKTEGGIAFTVLSDGAVQVEGSDSEYHTFVVADRIPLSVGRYRLVAGGNVSNSGVVIFNSAEGMVLSESPGSRSVDITLTEDTVVTVCISAKAGGVTANPAILPLDLSRAEVMDFGKNLIPPLYRGQTTVNDGIVFTDNLDGSVSAKGTATKSAQFRLNTGNIYLPAGVYTASGGVGGTILQIDGKYRYFGETAPTFMLGKGEALYRLTLLVNEGETVDTTFYPMLEAGETATAYEPQRTPAACPVADDGTVDVILGEDTTLYATKAGYRLRCEYHRDTNAVVAQLLARIAALEKNKKEGI